MTDYEQAYRDLRSGVEAHVPIAAQGHVWCSVADCSWSENGGITWAEHLLASSAPATASEGATTGCACHDVAHPWDRPATWVTSSDGDRGLSDEERRSLGCQCTRLDDVWHHGRRCPVPAVERILAARTAQPEGTERVEWGHRYPDGSIIPDSSETVARSRAAISGVRSDNQLVLMRRTVTNWKPVEEADRG